MLIEVSIYCLTLTSQMAFCYSVILLSSLVEFLREYSVSEANHSSLYLDEDLMPHNMQPGDYAAEMGLS